MMTTINSAAAIKAKSRIFSLPISASRPHSTPTPASVFSNHNGRPVGNALDSVPDSDIWPGQISPRWNDSRKCRCGRYAEIQAIRERLAAGRAKAAIARGETLAPKVFEVKPKVDHKSGSKSKARHGVIEMVVTKDTKVEKAIDDAKKSMAAKVGRI